MSYNNDRDFENKFASASMKSDSDIEYALNQIPFEPDYAEYYDDQFDDEEVF